MGHYNGLVRLVVPAPVTRERRRLTLRAVPISWHLLSLDAPSIAVLWAWSFTRAVDAPQSWSALVVLGLGTWLLYVADRLLDARTGSLQTQLRERHLFHARHRRAFLVAGTAALAPLAWILVIMPAATRIDDARLFGVAMLYFLAVHLPSPRLLRSVHALRNFIVAVIFACACAVPAWSASGAAHVDLVWIVSLFALLCWLNCAAIHAWESEQIPRRWSFTSTLAFVVAALAATLMTTARTHPFVFLLLGDMGCSALLLFALDRDFRRARRGPSQPGNLSPSALRILADAALLTPLLLLLPWHRK